MSNPLPAVWLAGSLACFLWNGAATPQVLTTDPGKWRPLAYTNLQQAGPDAAAYLDLWADDIAANNKQYVERGAMLQGTNAPAIEAHVVVRSPGKIAVLSLLSTGTGCEVKTVDHDRQAVVKLCPLRIAVYEGDKVSVTRGRKACFLEMAVQNPASDPTNTASWASYDVASKSFRLGVIINHDTVPGCSMTVPIYGLPQ